MATASQHSSRSEANTTLFPFVGIGASAGGLKSIESLFDNMPTDTGMAFIIIQHLSPDFKSLMTEIMSRHTSMPVEVATDRVTVQPNQVYLIPPGKELRCEGQTLTITDFPAGLHRPIDTFFKSLASIEGRPVAGIILSGTGSDGAEGIAELHKIGALTLAESAETAEFDGMPVSAARTGCIDFILAPGEMPGVLVRHEHTAMAQAKAPGTNGVRTIFSLLASRYNLQFDHYKPSTVARRLERRQKLGRFATIFEYADYLSTDEQELDRLFHDLLIGVTKFFRDEQAFMLLEKQIEASLEHVPEGEAYRVWTAGCATGEECYSIAMILMDVMQRAGREPNFKIFATDVHQRTLEAAAGGVYDFESMEYVSLARQERYFERLDNGQFRVAASLRKHLLFATHNLIQDPPFTKINLVSCRNVLIYFQSAAQLKSLATLHFSLVPNGVLFLGPAETLGELESEFSPLDRTWRIYRKVGDRRDLVSLAGKISELATPKRERIHLLSEDPSGVTVKTLLDIYDALLRTKIPLGMLLDRHQNLVHSFGDMRRIHKGTSGRFTGSLGDFLQREARTVITAAMMRAQKNPGTRFVVEQVRPNSEHETTYDVSVVALSTTATPTLGWILQFDTSEEPPQKTVRVAHGADSEYDLLESELEFTKVSLSTSIEELQASNQELQATNEEMIASNEELQSTNQELHSVNEELHSVNNEYQRKIDELEEITNDLETLLGLLHNGTIFLGADLRIRKFTPAITRYFKLMSHDVGRPLGDFANRLGLKELPELLQSVVTTGNEYSATTLDDYGELVFVKVVPCKADTTVTGAVLNVRMQSPYAQDVSKLMAYGSVGTWEWPDVRREEMWWSPTCYKLVGIPPETPAKFSLWKDMVHPEDLEQLQGVGGKTCRFVEYGLIRVRMKCHDNKYRSFEFRNISSLNDDGELTGLSGTISSSSVVASARGTESDRGGQSDRILDAFEGIAQAAAENLQPSLDEIRTVVRQLAGGDDDGGSVSTEDIVCKVSRQTDELDTMLKCLTQYSLINARPVRRDDCDTDQILADVLKELAECIENSKASISYESLPDVFADPAQLHTVLWHIIDNSIRFSGENPPEIGITAHTDDNHVTISIRDQGIGIDETHLGDIFTLFRRSGTSEQPGAGFGLALSKRIVERNGGNIWADSHPNAGTTIHIRLPATLG